MITGIRVKSFAPRNRHIAWPFDYGLTPPFHLAHTHTQTHDFTFWRCVCVLFGHFDFIFSTLISNPKNRCRWFSFRCPQLGYNLSAVQHHLLLTTLFGAHALCLQHSTSCHLCWPISLGVCLLTQGLTSIGILKRLQVPSIVCSVACTHTHNVQRWTFSVGTVYTQCAYLWCWKC